MKRMNSVRFLAATSAATGLIPLFGLALVIAGCGVTHVKDADPHEGVTFSGLRYPSPDAQLGEHLYPDEHVIADQLSAVIEVSIRKRYSAGTARNFYGVKSTGRVQ